MSLRHVRRHVGQLVIVGFAGETIPSELHALAREFDLGGVILFSRNVVDPEQVAELAREARTLATSSPVWVSVDQEGGRVARLRAPFTEWPPMITLGRSGDAALAARFARALGTELRAAGVTLDFAPVLDVHTNPQNPVIGDRALADRAEDVARLGRTIVEGLQAVGIAACGKHFPGHGDTAVDSHLDLPIVEHGLDRLEAIELVPFRAAIDADVAAIMTAHVLLPALDDTQPATLSPAVVRGLLREKLGFEGIVVSDDLEMRAIADRVPLVEAATRAIAAGCDQLLLCGTDQNAVARVLEGIIHAAEAEQVPLARVEDAFTRIRRGKERFLAGAPPPVAPRALASLALDAHREIAREMERFL